MDAAPTLEAAFHILAAWTAGALIGWEREARDNRLKRDERHTLRAAKSSPILGDFKKWLDHEAHVALPKSAIGQAIGYALNQWPDLVRYLEDGRLVASTAQEGLIRIRNGEG